MDTEYPWQEAYQQAVLEANDVALLRRINEARGVMNARLREIGPETNADEERAALTKALDAMWLLEQERLGRRASQ
jgi:hypothetical protein